MKRVYELVTIFSPKVNEERIQECLKKIKSIITSNNGTILHEDNWGSKKLAYKIKKFSTGIYHYMKFSCEPTLGNEIKKYLSTITEEVIRYSLIKINEKFVEPQLEQIGTEKN